MIQGLLNHSHNRFGVPAGSDLRHHAAVQLMYFDLRGDDARKQRPPVLHDRRGGLVAGAFQTQNPHFLNLQIRKDGVRPVIKAAPLAHRPKALGAVKRFGGAVAFFIFQ